MRNLSDSLSLSPQRPRYCVRLPFSIQGHTKDVYGPKSEAVPWSGRIFLCSKRFQTFISRRIRFAVKISMVERTRWLINNQYLPCFLSSNPLRHLLGHVEL